MTFDYLKFAGLFRSDVTINSIAKFWDYFLQALIGKRFKVKGSIFRIFLNLIQYSLSRFAERIRDNVSQLDIGNRETVLQSILFA